MIKKLMKIAAMCICLSLFMLTPAVYAEATEQDWENDYGVQMQWLLSDTDYRVISVLAFDDGTFYSFDAGTFGITASVDRYDYKNGVADSDGNIIVPIMYDAVFPFSEGRYFVRSGSSEKVINADGEEVFDVSNYDTVDLWKCDGFLRVTLNGKYGLIGELGEEILPCEYDDVGSTRYGLIWAKKDGLWRFFDETGEAKSEAVYSEVKRVSVSDGVHLYEYDELIKVVKDGKYGVVDKNGNEVLPCVYPEVMICDNDIIAVFEDGWKYINVNDESGSFYYVGGRPGRFSEGLAPVYIDGKYGYINKQWELVIPNKYSYVSAFKNGIASVREEEGGRGYLIDKTGKIVVEEKDYTIVRNLASDGEALTGRHYPNGTISNWMGPAESIEAILDSNGNRLTEFKYKLTIALEQGMVSAWKEGERYGLVNKNGEELTPFIFETIAFISDNKCVVTTKNNGFAKVGILTLPEDAAERGASFERPITVYVSGLDLYFDAEPIITNDRVMVPMRKIFETLGCEVSWEQESNTVTAVKGDTVIKLTIGENTAFVNDNAATLDAPAILSNSRTLVPIRFIAESLNMNVDWVADLRRVNISE